MSTTPTAAQTNGDPDPTDPVQEALEKAKAEAELRKAVAEAEKAAIEAEQAALTAKLPTSDTTGSTGGVELDGAGYFAEILAYRTLGKAAEAIVGHVKLPENASDDQKTVIVTTETDVSAQTQLWHLVNVKIDDLIDRLGETRTELEKIRKIEDLQGRESVGLAAVPAILGGIADIVAFFKTDRTLKGRTVTLDELALVADVAGKLPGAGWTRVIVPSLNLRGGGPLMDKLRTLFEIRRALTAEHDRVRDEVVQSTLNQLTAQKETVASLESDLEVAQNNLEEKQGRLDTLEKADPRDDAAIASVAEKISALEKRIGELQGEGGLIDAAKEEVLHLQFIADAWDRLKASVDTLIATTDAYLDTLTETGDDGSPPVATLHHVDLVMAHPDATVVAVKVVSGGAEIHVTERKLAATKVAYVGGSVCVYFVFSPESELVASGSVPVSLGSSFKLHKAASEASYAAREEP